jgi:beta-lactamase superfamily II metal-dependent hydrolase
MSIWAAACLPQQFRRHAVAGMLVGMLAGVAVARLLAQDSGAHLFRVSFIDVGQGDAIWIKGPQQDDGSAGGNLIIDGGPGQGPKNRLIKYLAAQSYGLQPGEAIDCMVASHPHDDHYPGLQDVLAKYEVRTIIDAGFPKEGPKFAAFLAAAKKETAGGKKSRVVELRSSKERTFRCGNIEARVLFADAANAKDMGSGNTRENNASAVIKVQFGQFGFLFMGDAEGKDRNDAPDTPKYAERVLLEQEKSTPGLLQSTVLKIAHHGSETSSTLPFIKAVNPDILVVMSGRKQYGPRFLPDKSTLDRYRKHNPKMVIVRTDERDAAEQRDTTNDADGDDVYIYTDGETLRVNRAVGPTGKKRWQHVKTIQRSIEP